MSLDADTAPEWSLKAGVLDEIRRYGGDVQQREPDAAAQRVERALGQAAPDAALALLEEALRLDALCAAAWQWLGLLIAGTEAESSGEIDATALARRLLITALVVRNNPEAWSNAIIGLWHRDGDSDELRDAIVCARFLSGEDVVPLLVAGSREWEDEHEVARFADILASVEPRTDARDFRIRFRTEDGAVEEFHFRPPVE